MTYTILEELSNPVLMADEDELGEKPETEEETPEEEGEETPEDEETDDADEELEEE